MKRKFKKSGIEIIRDKQAEEALNQTEQHIRLGPESIPSPARKMANLELADIIDVWPVQSLMDDFYKFAHITIAIVDLKGNVLIGVGWQDICTKFHRVHPETCKHCVESDTKLSAGVPPGEFKLYRCKNNMWDVVTPIMVDGKHIGNIFSGQFFFDDEPVDYELFRTQARKYGFNEEKYIAALEKVPRLSRETVETSMSFFMKFANMLSQLSHSNIKLAQSLEERNSLVSALQESEKRERTRSEELEAVLDAVPVTVFIAHDPQALQITGNRLSYEWVHAPVGTNFSKSAPEGERPEMFKLFKDGVEMQPADMPSQMAVAGIEVNNFELDIVSADGEIRHVLGNARPLRDERGNPRGSISAFIDITERKKAEETLAFERSQLLSIFDGMDDAVYVTDPYTYEVLYVNKAMKEKFGGELVGGICYREFQRRDSPCGFCTNPIILKERDKLYQWEYYNPTVDRYFMIMDRIIKWPDCRDVRLEIAKDITERKRTEEALRESEAKYRDVFDTVQEVFYIDRLIYDEQGNVIDWIFEDLNPAGFELLGLKDIDEARGKRGSEVLGREIASFYLPMIEKARQSSKSVTFQYHSPYVDKELLTSYIVRGDRLISAQMDVTELKKIEAAMRESEERLRLLGDNLPDSALYQYVYEPDGSVRFLYISTGIERLNGVSVSDVLRDPNTLYRQVPPEYLERLIKAEARSARELSDIDMELPMHLPNGQVKWMRLHSRPRQMPDGRTIWNGVQIDITENKQAEEALKKARETLEEKVKERTAELEEAYNSLKESERGFAEAQKMAHIGNWDNDLVIGELHWSEEMYRIFGRNPQEGITYDKFLSCIHPKDRAYVYNTTKEAFNGKVYATDYRIVRPDGEERIVHSEREVIFDETNNPVRMKGTVQDITEHKKSEEKIRSLANIVESSNDAIGTMSLDNIITSWNEEAEHVYGYSAEEILGKHTSILAPPHLDKETGELSEMIKQGKKIRHHETSRLRKDGKIIHVSITLSPVFDSHGKLSAISFISRDITERRRVEEKLRESEEKYRNIVETANEGIWILDAEARTTYVNKKMTEMLGYNQEEMIGRSVLDFADEECKTNLKLSLERRQKGVNESHELKLIRKDGSTSYVLVNAKSLLDKDGKFMGSMGMLTDITERKKVEEALKNIEIARKQEIHHRIKNNLQVISSLLDLQAEKFNNREDIKDSEILAAFRESQNRVMSIALIHEELHEGGGDNALYFSPYLKKLVENLFQTYSLGNTDVSLSMDLEDDVFFDMDTAVPLGIIVNELVSNSLKHAFRGRDKGEIQIKLYEEEKVRKEKASNGPGNSKEQAAGKGTVGTAYTLIASDDGIGIPEEIDLKNSDTLGLQLVSILVDQLDGEIELKRDRGTEFVIKINVQQHSEKSPVYRKE